jgi:hypothetical protein
MLTQEEAEKLKRKMARLRERDLERADREARGRAAALRSTKSRKKGATQAEGPTEGCGRSCEGGGEEIEA